MDRRQYYSVYQENIELLDIEIQQVKKNAQITIGKKNWLEKNGEDVTKVLFHEKEILASTRLMTFLVCSWFEARLMKMLYEESAVAFSDAEISTIRQLKQMNKKWQWAFYVAVGKATGRTYLGTEDYTMDFSNGSIAQKNYLSMVGMFVDMEKAITVRNRLAHGQWMTQLNCENTNITTYSFLSKYDNIQKLDILVQIFRDIAEIINKYVVYKDKQNPNFDQQVQKLVSKIEDKKQRIEKSDFHKYEDKLGKVYLKHQRKDWLSNDEES